jgi:hypothetical protein
MSRNSKMSSIVVACSIVVVLSVALVPASALAKGGGGPSMGVGSPGSMGGSSFQVSKSFGNSPISKNLGNFQITKYPGNSPVTKNLGNFQLNKNLGNLPVSKIPGTLPITKLGKLPINKIDPISKNFGKFPLCNPIDPCFCHHDFCCCPHWHWEFPWLVAGFEVVNVETVYAEPLYTLYYETADGIRVYSRYELPSESATLYKTEHMLDKSQTAWWLVSTTGELVDTNTEKNAVVKSTADDE